MATNFNIGSQNASSINMVGGDQHIEGGQHITNLDGDTALALEGLRAALDGAPLAAIERKTAADHIKGIQADLRTPNPDRRTSGNRLAALTTLLASVGAFATGGASLIASITAVAAILGRFGARALRILGDATST